MIYLASVVPHVVQASSESTWVTVIGALLCVGGVLALKRCPKIIVALVCILATAAVCATPVFGGWLESYLHNLTNGFLGK